MLLIWFLHGVVYKVTQATGSGTASYTQADSVVDEFCDERARGWDNLAWRSDEDEKRAGRTIVITRGW